MVRLKRKIIKPQPIKELKKRKFLEEYSKESLEKVVDIPPESNLDKNISYVKDVMGNSSDLVVRNIIIGGHTNLKAALIYLDGLTDNVAIDQYIMGALMIQLNGKIPADLTTKPEPLIDWIKDSGLIINDVTPTESLKEIIEAILVGDCAILLDGSNKALLANAKGWEKRSVDEPKTESVVRGPRDGFVETLRTNTALIRRRLKDPNIRVISLKTGTRTKTDVAIMYIEGIMDEKIVKEAVRRIKAIEIDGVLESGYIEQYIEDNPLSPFPQIQNTERPDKVASHLLEGKLAIIVDGTPYVLIAPAIFSQFYHSPEDYYERFLIGSMIRVIRIISMSFALLLPSVYIAFSSFHPEMIPSKLMIAMAAGRSTVPFPSIVEAFLMEITIEILREASVRLPGPIGPTIGIVGGLVVGQAAVEAGIVSPIMVIVVSLTTIGSFASPSYNSAISLRMLRFPIMVAAGLFGLYGIMLALILIFIHLCSLKPFGIPYLSSITPFRLRDMQDTLIRLPIPWMKKRPTPFHTQDKTRM
ncbi:spore germination protein [Mesobacillus harenae]|uniref:spore germination protein n=1 Tax=Mesobacillus harenae TaxID=2213203 RepID=UPI00158054A7|nr:spore germination protein [Mesobacillus harenae]